MDRVVKLHITVRDYKYRSNRSFVHERRFFVFIKYNVLRIEIFSATANIDIFRCVDVVLYLGCVVL